mmetsp:Transcript_1706/g.5045  ORF Transcript_1706/g.5045 Transcript_1706/m.5045 type:complete len:779 (+) Transcript_1706:610-2946(+)
MTRIASWPKEINLCTCALNDKVEKSLEFRCDIPVAFEYKIIIIQSHPQFLILTPRTGIIPPHGSIWLHVIYHPVTLGTSIMRVLIEISQLDSEPHVLSISGNAVPGITRRRLLDLAKSSGKTDESYYKRTHPLKTSQLPRSSPCIEVGDRDYKLSQYTANGEYSTEGLRVPVVLRAGDQQSTNYVLTQCPGKLKPRDLKQAIDLQRERREAQYKEQMALRSLAGEVNDPMQVLNVHSICADIIAPLRKSGISVSKNGETARQLKEMAFLQDIADLEIIQKQREFKGSEEFLGEPLLCIEEIATVKQNFYFVASKLLVRHHSAMQFATGTLLLGPAETAPQMRARVIRSDVQGWRALRPHYDGLAQDIWSKRAGAFQHLISLVGKAIIFARSAKRLWKIKVALGSAKSKPDVAIEHQQTRDKDMDVCASGSHSPLELGQDLAVNAGVGDAPTISALLADMIKPHNCRTRVQRMSLVFPIFEEDTAAVHKPVSLNIPQLDEGHLPRFDDLMLLGTQGAQALALSLRYSPMEPSQFPSHFPAHIYAGLREGACQESCTRIQQLLQPPHTKRVAALMDPMLRMALLVGGWAFLKSTHSERLLQSSKHADEASVLWPLQPKPVQRKLSSVFRVAAFRKAATANAYPQSWPTTFDCWRSRRECRASGLDCLSAQNLQPWANQSTVPRRITCSEDMPSDSESEDEPNNAEFSQHDSFSTSSILAIVTPRDDAKGASKMVISDMPRDCANLSLSRTENDCRNSAASLLSGRMYQLSKHTRSPLLWQ